MGSSARDPYRRVAKVFDRIFEPMNRGLRLIGLGMFRPTRDMAVLDVGCGTGIHLELYRRFQCSLSGIDTSDSMLSVAKKRLGHAADLRRASATEMPFEDASFDLVMAMLVLHEMDQEVRVRTIGEMKRVLKKDGRILLIDFHTGPYRFIKGWIAKAVIVFSEISAGRRHFRNYRHFMAVKGLPDLIQASDLAVEAVKIVGGGGLVLYLLRKQYPVQGKPHGRIIRKKRRSGK